MTAAKPAGRVLIVDDDPALLEALSQTLRLKFDTIAVDTCDNAPEALRKIAGEDYDAILSDVKMPGMDGLELLGKIQMLAAGIPTLLITGHGQTDLAIQALRGGAFDLIQKPLDREYVAAALRRAMETRRLRRDVQAKQAELQRYSEQLEQRVQERTAELQSALNAKDEFLGLVSHELRTPVTVILGNAEVLYSRGDRLSNEDKQGVLSDIRQESRRLKRIIENLLILARADYGAKPILEPIVLNRVVEEQVNRYRQFTPGRDIELEINTQVEVVNCDATHVELILGNLLSNADKYSPAYEAIKVGIEDVRGELVISVLDRGTGVKLDEVEKLFQPFYRSKSTENIAGIGIGLTVCKRLIEAYGGRLWATPRSEGGSAFHFSLPSSARFVAATSVQEPQAATR
jgi:K+-sensing histidine kinase KdpD